MIHRDETELKTVKLQYAIVDVDLRTPSENASFLLYNQSNSYWIMQSLQIRTSCIKCQCAVFISIYSELALRVLRIGDTVLNKTEVN